MRAPPRHAEPTGLEPDTRWHVRIPLHEDLRAFRRILEFHALTREWIALAGHESAEAFLKPLEKNVSPDLRTSFLILSSENISPGLECDHPKDVLIKLHHVSQAAHLWVYKKITEQTQNPDVSAGDAKDLKIRMETQCFKAGRDAFKASWSDLAASHRNDLRVILSCFQSTWLTGPWGKPPFLTCRAFQERVEVELLRCPHQLDGSGNKSERDDLCRLHSEWMRGFVYEANPGIRLDRLTPKSGKRCGQVWTRLVHSVGSASEL